MKKIILISAGGHASSCIDIIEKNKNYKIVGLIGKKKEIGRLVNKYKVLGTDQDLISFYRNGIKNAFIAIGGLNNLKLRLKIYNLLKRNKFNLPNFISKNAIVSKSSNILEGSIIMHGAIVNANSTIGKICILNSRALVEHDCYISKNVHISTGSIVNGNSVIGSNSFLGSNSTIKNNSKIKENSFIKMGAIYKD